jgi:uncharacterized membrane protein YhaH (DUF805 family)
MKWYLMALKRFADFNGRSRRSEYWFFYLFSMIIIVVLSVLSAYVPALKYLMMIYYVGMIVPLIAAGVRRMHDVGKSGWYLLIPIYSLILLFTAGIAGTNEYGPDPKDPAFEEEINKIGQNS